MPGSLACALADRDRLERARAIGAELMGAWQAREDVRALRDRLMAMDAALPADAMAFADALMPWLVNDGWYRDLIGTFCQSLSADALAELPMGMQSGGLMQALALIEAGGAYATLAQLGAERLAVQAGAGQARRLVFDSGFSLVFVVAGTIEVELWRLDRGNGNACLERTCRMGRGALLAQDNRTEQLIIHSAPTDALLLNMAVAGPDKSGPTLEFDAHSGQLLRRGTADPAVSRMLLLLPLIPTAGPEGRCELLSRLCRDADPMLRWQAMRYWLAEDARDALPVLTRMADDDADPSVRTAAKATMALIARMTREAAHAG